MKKVEYFLVGIFAALGAVIVEIIFDALRAPLGLLDRELLFVAVFVLIEELAKFIVIRRKIDFDKSVAKLLSDCFWIGLGFGLLEWGILLLNDSAAYAGNTPAIAAVILVHVMTALLTGAALAKLKNRSRYTILAIGPALLLHLAFNYWILAR